MLNILKNFLSNILTIDYYKIFLLLRIGLIIISFVRWRDKYNSIGTVNTVYRVIFLDMINIKITTK